MPINDFDIAMKKVIVLFFCLVSCTSELPEINENFNKESTYTLQSSGYLRIQPPEEFNGSKGMYSIQYVESGNKQYLAFFDLIGDAIYWMEYPSGKIIADKTIELTIPHQSILRFYALSPDSVFVLDYSRISTFYLLDAKGVIISGYDLGERTGAMIGNEYVPFRTTDDVLLASFGYNESITNPAQRKYIFCCHVLNMASKEFGTVPEVDYPPKYYRYHWGGGQMRFVFTEACYPLNIMLYSFPASHDIYAYDVHEKKVKKYNGGSSLIEKISPYSSKKVVNAAEDVDYNKYFFEQPSYYKIIYDPYRSLFYRLVGLPSEKFDIKERSTYRKKLSIIILDENFQFLGETLLDEQHATFDAFVNENGLHIDIKNENPDDKTIIWHVFEPQKINL